MLSAKNSADAAPPLGISKRAARPVAGPVDGFRLRSWSRFAGWASVILLMKNLSIRRRSLYILAAVLRVDGVADGLVHRGDDLLRLALKHSQVAIVPCNRFATSARSAFAL